MHIAEHSHYVLKGCRFFFISGFCTFHALLPGHFTRCALLVVSIRAYFMISIFGSTFYYLCVFICVFWWVLRRDYMAMHGENARAFRTRGSATKTYMAFIDCHNPVSNVIFCSTLFGLFDAFERGKVRCLLGQWFSLHFFFLLVLTLEVHNTKKKNKMLEQIMTLVLFRGRTEGFVGIRDLRSDISHRNSSDDDYYYYYEHRCKPLCRDLDCLMLRCTATTKHVVCPFFCRRT